MNSWKLLITRETVLLERYLRIDGYRNMFGNKSGVKIGNLFVVNKNGLTSQYDFQPEIDERIKIIWSEYENNYLEKLLPFWSDVIEKLKKFSDVVLAEKGVNNFQEFVSWYQSARGIVFYTHYLGKLLELKNLEKETKSIGEWHEKAEVESCAAWDKLSPFFRLFQKNIKYSKEI